MGLATGVNAETAAKLRARRRRWVAVGVGLVAVILIASVIASLLFSRAGSDSVVGRVDTSVAGTLAPEFELPGLTGRRIRLQQFQGSIVVVNVWASWCVPCREEVGALKAVEHKWRRHGVRLVGIVENDTASAARRFQDQNDVPWPSVLDADRTTATEFGVRGVPETYVVGRDGRLAGKIIGRLRDGQLDAVISDLLQPSSIKGSTSQSGQ